MNSNNKIVYVVNGTKINLEKFFKATKLLGEIEDLSLQKTKFNDCAVLSCLTEKQRRILVAAKKNGYYNYPRKITSIQLSAKIGISKATVIEHLRKAENRIMSHVISSHWFSFGISTIFDDFS